jgi:hypothetical protein
MEDSSSSVAAHLLLVHIFGATIKDTIDGASIFTPNLRIAQ